MTENILSSREQVGVIGLGIMGLAISSNLVKAGFEVFGTDINLERCRELERSGGISVSNTKDLGKHCRYIILCLPSEAALEIVANDLGTSCDTGAIVIETGTFSLASKEKARDVLASYGIILLDCTILGHGALARKGELEIYASGEDSAISKVTPIFNGFSRICHNLGDFGNGTKMKLIANLLLTVHIGAAAEAILLGKRSGLDPAMVVKILGNGVAGSGMLKARGPVMVERTWDDAWMKQSIWQKDIKAILEALRDANCPAPLFSATLPIYTSAVASGHSDHDTASVYEILERMCSL
ncbi:MAG TPA: NAD(P)-dependent oxidoreductase [Negativicutes bacterium]|jgi:3-hydroxyisobutyrate dehydrogenase-like beta-hydroxyacid dehydrogenase